MGKDLKSILSKLEFPDDAKVMQQLVDQTLQVKTRMGLIRRKLVVLSGKGGVGKSMVTVNLALAFADRIFGWASWMWISMGLVSPRCWV